MIQFTKDFRLVVINILLPDIYEQTNIRHYI